MLLKELKKSFKLTNNFITMTCPSGMKSPKVKGVWSKSCGQAKNKNYAFADEKKKKWQRNARKEWPPSHPMAMAIINYSPAEKGAKT